MATVSDLTGKMAGLKVSSPKTKQTKRSSPSKGGYVYLVTDGTNSFKVGRTEHPDQRRRGLQTGNPKKLEMVTGRVSDMSASEKRLLQEMKGQFYSTGGGKEWFTGDVNKARRVFRKVAGSK